MSRSLLIAVRFQEGRYHGREDGFDFDDAKNGWPPSPGRLFQALVAAVAVGASISEEDERALRWLEGLDPPRIAAPAARRGRAVKLFVPNNDLDTVVGGDLAQMGKIRANKEWRPCFFDPGEPILYVWDFEAGAEEAMRLCSIAARLYQLGRGIDMAWASGQVLERDQAEAVLSSHPGAIRQPRPKPRGAGETAVPGPGMFDSLVDRYRLWRERLRTVKIKGRNVQAFTQPPKAYFPLVGYDTPPRHLHFELRGPEGGFAPRPLASAASLITGLRDAAAVRLQEESSPEESRLFERLIIGRGAGPADLAQRLRLIPIPSVGTEHTDPSIRRILVEVPSDCPLRIDDLKWAFSGLEPLDPQTGEIWPGRLVSTDDSRMAERFKRSARAFRSVTPLALSVARRRIDPARVADEAKDGVERAREEAQACSAVVRALRQAGVRGSPVDVCVQREPFYARGERAESFAAGTRFSKHALWHARIAFAEPVPVFGPLLLGDGRYLGLGLMLPDEARTGILAFAIEAGLADAADPQLIAQAARRAMMARVQACLPMGKSLPAYVSGHDADGGPAGGGHHHHIAVVADIPRRRLLYVAPNLLHRGGVQWRDIAADHRRTVRALEHMDILRAGRAGRLVLVPAALDASTDPLLAAAQVWHSVTDYQVTRHGHRLTDEEALRADVQAELQRIGWPVPKTLEILEARRGPRGGLSGRLRLAFARVQRGPLIIGRTVHKGGGLFASSV